MEAKDKAEELVYIVKASLTENISDKTAIEVSELITRLVSAQHAEIHKSNWVDTDYYIKFREHFELWRNIKSELEKMKSN